MNEKELLSFQQSAAYQSKQAIRVMPSCVPTHKRLNFFDNRRKFVNFCSFLLLLIQAVDPDIITMILEYQCAKIFLCFVHNQLAIYSILAITAQSTVPQDCWAGILPVSDPGVTKFEKQLTLASIRERRKLIPRYCTCISSRVSFDVH